jgi:hypothetical protein
MGVRRDIELCVAKSNSQARDVTKYRFCQGDLV